MKDTFGKYSIERKLGEGGMGAVYLASDTTLQRQVALKIMTVKGEELVERFHREAQAMAKLKHPNIIPVYEVGIVNNRYYFTMEYIKGASLDDRIKDKKNRLSSRQVAEIIRDVADALDYAHKQGLIHRDIKPDNILLGANNRPYLMDFGLAKELTGLDRSLTMSGTIIGTPDYMSPEQAIGDKKSIDSRGDIFSLGATLYHSLTGHLPFRGKELYQLLDQVVNKDPIQPSRLVRNLPRDLETICLKCLEKEKDRRYQTSKALTDDLNRYLRGEPISARPAGLFSRLLKKAKKNKIATFSILGVAVVLLGLIIGLFVSSANKNRQIEEYRQKAQQSFTEDNLERASAWCNKLLALSPDDEGIKLLLRKVKNALSQREDKLRAEKEAEKARADRLQKDLDKTIKELEDKLRAEKEEDKASETIKIIIPEISAQLTQEKATIRVDLTSKLADSLYERCLTYAKKGEYEKAITDGERFLKLAPNHPQAEQMRKKIEEWKKMVK
jgi:tetratricopeptide (TPR) repeat protein